MIIFQLIPLYIDIDDKIYLPLNQHGCGKPTMSSSFSYETNHRGFSTVVFPHSQDEMAGLFVHHPEAE
jgi:hypothetical protein